MSLYKITSQKLYQRKYAKNTIDSYLGYIDEFETTIGKPYSRLNAKDFQNYIDSYTFSSISKQNIVISALKFSWEQGLGKKYLKIDFTRPRKQKKLPRVIEKSAILEKIDNIENIKHKAILSLMYGTGLRASELLGLKVSDIDSNRMLILVRDSKFNKDRYVPFSKNNLILLRSYFKKYRPVNFLFEGVDGKYSYASLKNISVNKLGVTPHLIRHSYATALVEAKTNLRVIQKLLGHANSKTTEIYTHVSNEVFDTIELPN